MGDEKRIELQIVRYVFNQGGFAVKLHADGMQGRNTLDLMGSFKGKPFNVEIKTPEGVTSYLQWALVHRARKGGYIAGVVTSLAEFIALFEGCKHDCK